MDNIFKRFLIEPRSGGKYSYSCWLVVYDRETEKYIKDEGSRLKYKTFDDSDEVFKYLKKHYY